MTTKSVGNNRLLKLADFLEALPLKNLTMSAWWQPADQDRWDSGNFSDDAVGKAIKLGALRYIRNTDSFELTGNVTPKLANECGFAGCAVGWAATYKPFRRAGLRMVMGAEGPSSMAVQYGDNMNIDAVDQFFGLQQDSELYHSYESEWEYLFGPEAYGEEHPTPARVAKRIRKFVARRKAGKPGLPKRLVESKITSEGQWT